MNLDGANAKSVTTPAVNTKVDAADARSSLGEPLGMAHARIVSGPMVAVENRPSIPVMEPRDYKARRFYIRREVELAKCGFSAACEGCRVAQEGAESKPHSEGCRERIRQAMMNDDVAQQRLRAAEQRGSSAGEQPSVATRVEAAQGPDEAMNQALAASSAREATVASSARNVRPRTAESGRMEDVVPSRKRGSEEMGPPDDPNLTPADESQMGIIEMAVILMSLGVAPANFTVAELFCRNRFGDSVVDMAFERGLVVDGATGWSMGDEEQMEEVEQRIRDEEPVLLIGSPMCRAFSTLTERGRSRSTS